MFMYVYLRFAVGINASLSGQILSSQCCEPFVYLRAVIHRKFGIMQFSLWLECIVRFVRGEFYFTAEAQFETQLK